MTTLRPDLAIIAENIRAGSRVLDVGCGDGALMAALRDEKGVDARGLEIEAGNVSAAVTRGLGGGAGRCRQRPCRLSRCWL